MSPPFIVMLEILSLVGDERLPRRQRSRQWITDVTIVGTLRVLAAAGASAALLICDAWFDILTSPASNRWIAVTEALLVELPLAVACLVIARDAERAFERARKVAETAHRLAVTRSRRAQDASRDLP